MKVGINFSWFNFLYARHVKMEDYAKGQCDDLIVALQLCNSTDRHEKMRLKENERMSN